jgi:hypothetical protein
VSGRRSEETWSPALFFQAVAGGKPIGRWGYVFRGLALHHSGWASPRSKTQWKLTHIGSGGSFLKFTGAVSDVFPVAREIAECSDWTLFDLPEGWRQTDPDLPAKVGAICEAHPEVMPDCTFSGSDISDADARAVIAAREQAA